MTQGGDLKEGEGLASEVFDRTYLNQYVAHATIETHTALARLEGDRVTVWVSTQTPFRVKDEVAQALGIPSQNVRIIAPFVGGGFGGKSMSRQAVEAARLARRAGKPVQVAWSRQEEFFYDDLPARRRREDQIRGPNHGEDRLLVLRHLFRRAQGRRSNLRHPAPSRSLPRPLYGHSWELIRSARGLGGRRGSTPMLSPGSPRSISWPRRE